MVALMEEVLIFENHLDSSALMLFISEEMTLNGNLLGLQMITHSPLDRKINIKIQRKLIEIKSSLFKRQFYYVKK